MKRFEGLETFVFFIFWRLVKESLTPEKLKLLEDGSHFSLFTEAIGRTSLVGHSWSICWWTLGMVNVCQAMSSWAVFQALSSWLMVIYIFIHIMHPSPGYLHIHRHIWRVRTRSSSDACHVGASRRVAVPPSTLGAAWPHWCLDCPHPQCCCG